MPCDRGVGNWVIFEYHIIFIILYLNMRLYMRQLVVTNSCGGGGGYRVLGSGS